MLRELFSDSTLDRVISVESHNTVETTPPKRSSPIKSKPLINVSLLRQVAVTTESGSTWKNITLTEGSTVPVPPDSMSWYEPSDLSKTNIDWDGELLIADQNIVGGFTAAHVQIKDFIALTVSPPPSTSILPLQLTIPIRLVSDPYAEVAGLEGRM